MIAAVQDDLRVVAHLNLYRDGADADDQADHPDFSYKVRQPWLGVGSRHRR